MSHPLRFLAAWTLALSLAASCDAGSTFLADGYALRVWQTEDGLPQNIVTSAIQTRDGFLWFGTYSGLARFDGERFEIFDTTTAPELGDQRIESLFEDAKGTLWIGHETGGITRCVDGKFEPVALPTQNKDERVIAIGSDENGQVWAMHMNGDLDALEGSGRHLPSLIAPDPPSVMAWSRSPGGSIWVAENGQAAQLVEGVLVPIPLGPRTEENYARSVAAAGKGVWILSEGRIRRWENGRWAEDRGEYPWPSGSLSCSQELRDGTLAIGTIYSGLYLLFPDGRPPVHFDRSNGLPQNRVRFVQEDREGNLWVGAGSAGVVSIHVSAFSILNSPDQWLGCPTTALAPARDGALWIGTDGAGLYRYADDKWTHYGDAEGLYNPYISAVVEGPGARMWVGNFWWGSPYRLEHGRFVRPPGIDETSSPVFALVPGAEPGEMLVGNRTGVLRLAATGATWLLRSSEADAGVWALAKDGRGGLWCGLAQGGIAHVANGKIATYRHKDGLASDAVLCLRPESDGTLWIGTADRGLVRFKDGKFATLSKPQGLVDSAICYILEDQLGYLWLGSHHGLQRVAKTELNRCADGTIPTVSAQIYDRSDGLPTLEFTGGLQASGCKTDDGRLWFASSKGVISVDPARVRANGVPPPVVLESLRVDGRAIPYRGGAALPRLAPGHQHLEFRFGGLSYVAPNKVLFRYRLDGIDDAWVESGAKRTAVYSRLPAGAYRFRVIACNNDGVWNTDGASLAFTVAPFFWQTWWFIGSCLLAAATIIAWLARYFTRRRMQRQMEQLERRQTVERERARIAQDIHDDIGTTLTRITMLSQPAGIKSGEPQQARAVLSRICSIASEATRALDEIVWAVDPRQDTLDSAMRYMGKFAQDMLVPADIRCRLDLPLDLPVWPLTAELRHNLFLAFKEALNNTLKHAAATEVHLSLTLQPDSFVLTVKDDGRGFARDRPASEPGRISSGNGLPNMERRLTRIGGRCEIATTAHGTSVSFIVPVLNQTKS